MKLEAPLALVDELRVRGVMQFSIGNVQVVMRPLPETSKRRVRRRKAKRIGFK